MDQVPAQEYPNVGRPILKILAFIFVFLIVALLAFNLAANRFGKFWEKKTAKTPPKTAGQPKLRLTCPVFKNYCQQGKAMNYNGNPALVYSLPEGTMIKSASPSTIVDSFQFVLQPYKKENPIGLYQTFIFNDNCYTITYTFPSDTLVKKIDLLPLSWATLLATVSANLVPVENEKANFILQLQKRSIDPSTTGQPASKQCGTLEPSKTGEGLVQRKDFGTFEKISLDLFRID